MGFTFLSLFLKEKKTNKPVSDSVEQIKNVNQDRG